MIFLLSTARCFEKALSHFDSSKKLGLFKFGPTFYLVKARAWTLDSGLGLFHHYLLDVQVLLMLWLLTKEVVETALVEDYLIKLSDLHIEQAL
jgi:hypothetical protein